MDCLPSTYCTGAAKNHTSGLQALSSACNRLLIALKHRFGENFLVNVGDQIFKIGSTSSDAKAKLAAQILKGITDLAKIGWGDSLHQFGKGASNKEEEALKSQRDAFAKMKDFNDPNNRRDAFEAEPPAKAITWDEIQEAKEIADSLFDAHADPKDKAQKKSWWSKGPKTTKITEANRGKSPNYERLKEDDGSLFKLP